MIRDHIPFYLSYPRSADFITPRTWPKSLGPLQHATKQFLTFPPSRKSLHPHFYTWWRCCGHSGLLRICPAALLQCLAWSPSTLGGISSLGTHDCPTYILTFTKSSHEEKASVLLKTPPLVKGTRFTLAFSGMSPTPLSFKLNLNLTWDLLAVYCPQSHSLKDMAETQWSTDRPPPHTLTQMTDKRSSSIFSPFLMMLVEEESSDLIFWIE